MNNDFNNIKVEQEIYNDIKKILLKIKYCRSKSAFNHLTEELNSLYLLCDEFDLYSAEGPEKYISRGITIEDNNIKRRIFFNQQEKFAKYILDNYDHFINFSSQNKLFDDMYFDSENIQCTKIHDINKIINYAKDFMTFYDKRFIDSFNELENNNHMLLSIKSIFDLYEAVFIPTKYCDYPYMGIFFNENIDDASSIVHEIAHMVNFKFSNNNTKTRNYPYYYQEVYSHYAQFVFYDYMKKNNMYNQDIDNFFKSAISLLGSNLASINYTLENDDLDSLEDLFGDIQYGYGIALALKYYDIYKDDPEKAKYFTEQFIEHSYHYEPIETLNKFGLNEEELISGELIKKYIK